MIIDSPIISGSYAASGSLNQAGNITITGSLTVTGAIIGAVTGSVDSASFANTAISASLAQTASFVQNAVSASFATTATSSSFASSATSASFASTASFIILAQTASFVQNAVSASFASFATSASFASNATSASFASTATSASFALSSTSASFATTSVTSSFANSFTVAGTLIAQTINVQQVTSSIIFSSGSNIFGNSLANTQSMTGSVSITGSLNINGATVGTVTSVASTAGTGITISGSPITTSGTLTITNSAPDQVVALTPSTGISISGTYPNFTITNTSPSSGGTVTSVGLSSATSGVTIGATPVTTSGTITLAIATASGSQNGLLSSTDWTTFNGKYNLPSLTAGSVLFSNGSTIAQDNANLFYDDANNRLGIGINSSLLSKLTVFSPDAVSSWNSVNPLVTVSNLDQSNGEGFALLVRGGALDVNCNIIDVQDYSGNSKFNIKGTGAATFSSSVTAGGKGIFETNTTVGNDGTFTGYASVGLGGTTNGFNRVFGGVGTADGLFLASATGRGIFFRAGGGTIDHVSITSGGSVLIGTTSDAGFKLDVSGDARFGDGNNFNALIQFAGSGRVAGSPAYSFVGDLDTGMFNPNLGNTIAFSTAGVERLRIDASGNLGLGVTPSAWDATGAGGPIIQIGRGLIFGADTETRYIFNAFYGTGTFRYIASSIAASNYQQAAGEHRFFTAPSGTAGNAISFTQAMTLDASGNLMVATTTPIGKVTFQQSTDSTIGGLAIVSVDGNGAVISRLNDGGLTFRNGGAERMRIASTGAATFSSSLQVNGGSRLIGNAVVGGDTSEWILSGVANGGAIFQKTHSGAGGPNDRYLRLGNIDNNGNPNYVLSIISSNVGINNTNPTVALDVSGAGRFTDALTGTSATFSQGINVTGNGGFFNSANKFGLDQNGITSRFYANGSNTSTRGQFEFHINSSDGSLDTIALGIASTGAATFSSSVTAGGDVNIPNGNYYYAKRNTGGANINVLGIASGTDITTLKGGTSGATTSINFEDTGGIIASFFNGRLGIGTTAPTEKLDVVGGGLAAGNGTIRTGITFSTLGLVGTFTNHDLGIITNGTTKLTLASTGAATFSSSVTATDFNLSALNTAPATAGSTGTTGQIRINANHIYVCTATNTWKRVAIATF